jgi:hypothetical protein
MSDRDQNGDSSAGDSDEEETEFVEANFQPVAETDQRGVAVVNDEFEQLSTDDRFQVETGQRAGETHLVVGTVDSQRRGRQIVTVQEGMFEPTRWEAANLEQRIETGAVTILTRGTFYERTDRD